MGLRDLFGRGKRLRDEVAALRKEVHEARASSSYTKQLAAQINGLNLTGVYITPRNALTISTAWACINAITTDFSTLPAAVKRKQADGSSLDVRDHPLSRRFRTSFDNETPRCGQLSTWMLNTLIHGTGYQELKFNSADGRFDAAYLLDSCEWEPRRRERDGGLYYRNLLSSATIPAYRMLALGGLGPDGTHGYSPVRAANGALGLGLAIEQFKAAFFGNSCAAGGILTTDATITAEGQERAIEQIEQQCSGPERWHKPIFVGGGAKFNPWTVAPEHSQLNESEQWQVLQICRFFRCPPHKAMDLGRATWANVEQMQLAYTSETIGPWCVRSEYLFDWKCLTEVERDAGHYTKFNLDALLRTDAKTRAEVNNIRIMSGQLLPNEARAKDDLPSVEGGDIAWRQGALLPLDPANPMNQKPAAPPPAGAAVGAPTVPDPSADPTPAEPTNGQARTARLFTN